MKDLTSTLQDFDAALPLSRARTIPSRWYRDPEVLAVERAHVFGGAWQYVARLDQLTKPGSYVTAEVGGEPVVVVRDEKGQLRAMSNVCRHRAAVIMREPEGCAERLRCRYHAWTYDLTGKLRGLPEFDGVEEFCKEEQGLPAHRVATWGPHVWVALDGAAAAPNGAATGFAEALAPMPERLATEAIDSLKFVERREYTLRCNWKVFVDNYLDGGYHVNTVHPGLAGVLDYKEYKTEIFGKTSVQTSPITAPKAGETSTSLVRTGKLAQYWFVYPNFMLNLYEGMMDTNLVLPIDAETCRVVIDFFFAKGGDEAKKSIAVGHEIQLEDIGICEDVQRGLHSRSYDKGRFSVRREIAGHHFSPPRGRKARRARALVAVRVPLARIYRCGRDPAGRLSSSFHEVSRSDSWAPVHRPRTPPTPILVGLIEQRAPIVLDRRQRRRAPRAAPLRAHRARHARQRARDPRAAAHRRVRAPHRDRVVRDAPRVRAPARHPARAVPSRRVRLRRHHDRKDHARHAHRVPDGRSHRRGRARSQRPLSPVVRRADVQFVVPDRPRAVAPDVGSRRR